MATTYPHQDFAGKFSHRPMQNLVDFLMTYNCESQVVAKDGNVQDIQNTGTKLAFIEGLPITLAVDAALDVSADTEGTLTDWATATAYVVGDIRAGVADQVDGKRFYCKLAHTSATESEPGRGDIWEKYWERRDHDAVNASGTSVADGSSLWMMITAKSDGTLTLWKASDVAVAPTLNIPYFDPKTYVVIGFVLYANTAGDSNADVIGNASTCNFSTYGTFVQVTGPVFPSPANWDKN